MAIFLFIMFGLSILSGFITVATSETALQQLNGGVSFVCSAVFLVGAAVVNSINKLNMEPRCQPGKPAGARDGGVPARPQDFSLKETL